MEGRNGRPGGFETRRLRVGTGRTAVPPGRRGAVRERDFQGHPGGRGRTVEDQGPGYRGVSGYGRRAPDSTEVAQRIQRIGLQAESRKGRARRRSHGDLRTEENAGPGLQPDHPVERRPGHIRRTPAGEHRIRPPYFSSLPVRDERGRGPFDTDVAAPGRDAERAMRRPSRAG